MDLSEIKVYIGVTVNKTISSGIQQNASQPKKSFLFQLFRTVHFQINVFHPFIIVQGNASAYENAFISYSLVNRNKTMTTMWADAPKQMQ